MTITPVVTNNPEFLYESCTENNVEELPPESEVSDAIMKPRLVYTNGYDTGRHQSFQRELLMGGDAEEQIGDLNELVGWEYVATGGENGGGYVLSKANTLLPTQGQYSMMPMFTESNSDFNFPDQIFGTPDDKIVQAAKGIRINLFGQTLLQPMNCFGLLGNTIFGLPLQLILQILPDRTVQVARVVSGVPVPVGSPSTLKIPATGWFKLSWQAFISALGNPDSGYAIVKRYAIGDSAKGVELLKHVGVNTLSTSFDTINGWIWGTEVITGAGPGLDGIGFDDVDLHLAYGEIKKFPGNIYIDKLIANNDGDTIESEVEHDGTYTRAEVGASSPGPGDPVGAIIVHGQIERYKNLAGSVTAIDSKLNDELIESFNLGSISPFTGAILDTPVADTPNVRSGIDSLIYNTLYENQFDLYQMSNPRANIIIVGITPLLLIGNRKILFNFTSGPEWNGAALHLDKDESNSLSVDRAGNHLGEVIIKSDGVIQGVRSDFTHSILGNWSALTGYTRLPYSTLITKPDNITKYILTDLESIQVGLRVNDLNSESTEFTWNQVMLAQVLLEYAYLLEEASYEEHPNFPPIPKLVQMSGTNLDVGFLSVRDASVSWDATIVSRILDWNDGSPTEEMLESSRLNPSGGPVWIGNEHTYTQSGTQSPFITVTDSHGLIASHTLNVTIPHSNPVANFSIAGDDTEITFTDLSVGVLSSIVEWLWDFGDGITSTLQNPVHTYAIDDTYAITLTVTDNHGLTNTIIVDVIVPIPIPVGDCDVSAEAIADLAFVQGDNFDGGFPPIPAPINLAAFDDYYYGSTFRASYTTGYDNIDDGISHSLDSTVLFRGHQTLKMAFGSIPAPAAPHTFYVGAGWDSYPTDDADPDETYYAGPKFGPETLWYRTRFKCDSGIMSDPSSNTNGNGLIIIALNGSNVFMQIALRGGHLWLDYSYRLTAGSSLNNNGNVDLGLSSDFEGSSTFGELITLFEGDNTAHTAHMRVWFGESCSLDGISPIIDLTVTANVGTGFTVPIGLAVDRRINHFNWSFTPTGALKYLWLADWEMMPTTVSANPFNVALT